MSSLESDLENELIAKLRELKYSYREDIRDRAALESNFRQHFQALNGGTTLTDAEFSRLLDEIVTADVFEASERLALLTPPRNALNNIAQMATPGIRQAKLEPC